MSRAKADFVWPDDSQRQIRKVSVEITKWTHKVFGNYKLAHESLFQFEGIVFSAQCIGLHKLPGFGEIVIPEYLTDPEADRPLNNCPGVISVNDSQKQPNYFEDPSVGITLFANKEMQAELFDVFSVAFTSASARRIDLFLSFTLTKPTGADHTFWQTEWHKGNVYIDAYHFALGGCRRR